MVDQLAIGKRQLKRRFSDAKVRAFFEFGFNLVKCGIVHIYTLSAAVARQAQSAMIARLSCRFAVLIYRFKRFRFFAFPVIPVST